MQHFSHHCCDLASLDALCATHDLRNRRGLIQVFVTECEESLLQTVLERLQRFPGFAVIGASAAGAIAGGDILDQGVLLSVTVLERTSTQIKTYYVAQPDAEAGRSLGMALAAEGARLALAFGNVLDENPEPFLEGFAAGAPELVLAGGVAADNLRFHGTFVIHGDQVYSRGLVLAAFYGQDLHVRTESLLNCTSVGRPMRITRAREECVYEIDGKPVLDVYRYYLGEEVLENIPVSMVEFPLIARTQGVDVARLPVSLTEDGALRYAGRLRMEEPVRFGIGDIFTMLERAREAAERLACHVPAEALYVYSCIGRRLYLKEHAPIELGSLAAVAPAAGFFTYGEFFHLSGDNRLLNMTTTAVIVAESDEIHSKSPVLRQKLPAPNRTLRALAHLSEVTSQELAQSMRVLEQYRYALDQTAIVSRTDLQGRIMYVNALFEQVTGYRAEELMGNSHSLLRHPDTPSAVYESLWRTIRAKQIWRGVIKNRAKDGRAYYLKSTIIPLLDEHGEILEYISVAEDITEIIQAQERIERQTVDRLTGLPNRNSLIEVIERDRFGMLALLDVAGFKSINEYYGFEVGDRVIVELAARLVRYLQPLEIGVYRSYGACFALVAPQEMPPATFEAHLRSLRESMHSLRVLVGEEEEEIDLEFYVGMAIGGDHLLALAESALQKAKEEGVREGVFVLSGQNQSYLKNRFWINEIKQALHEERLLCHFQPIVPVSMTGERPKYEALLRLRGRDGTLYPPGEFLDIVKQTSHYFRITRRVLELALDAAQRSGAQVSVNLSYLDVSDERTRTFILDLLARGGGAYLVFEITETEAFKDPALIRDFADEVRRHGAQLALDDFGSGYSNLSALVQLVPDYLKLDGSLIVQVEHDENVRQLVKAATDFSRVLGMKVVAEFVRNESLARRLRALGVDYLQGYALGVPGPLP